jgi:coproporphyrinogen III oxidase-like Fe-S oxidoreductase
MPPQPELLAFGDYLGIGAGAHSKLTLHDRVLRQMRWKQPKPLISTISAAAAGADETQVELASCPSNS